MRIDNPDNLPYFVMSDGQPLRIRFTPLEAEDARRIAEFWEGAVYFPLWQEVASHEANRQTTLKLIAANGSDDRILGLLRMGSRTSMYAASRGLNTFSVLEAAPRLQHRQSDRRIQGGGKVLVARLIAESVLCGSEGGLTVTPRRQIIPFYQHLGFQRQDRNPNLFSIPRDAGIQLLKSVLMEVEENDTGRS